MTQTAPAMTSADETRVLGLVDRLVAEHDPNGDRHEFMGAQFDLGLAWVHFRY